MKPDDQAEAPEETLALLLESYDAALAAGQPAECTAGNMSAVLQTELEGLQACLRRLERAWPRRGRSRSGPAENPALPDPLLHQGPARLGRYHLIRLLGSGGCGLVYLAWDPHLRREVAVKVPRPEMLLTPAARARLVREAQTAAGLDHPHLVPIYEVGEAGPAVYLVSAYCPGPTLEEWLNAHPTPVPVQSAAELLACLADVVQYMHTRGVLHRDLKPANILLSAERGARGAEREELRTPRSAFRAPKLTDFGLAKDLQRQTQLTRTGTVVGTPAYMAPEQAEGRLADIGPAADVYALGVILYRVLTGRVPFLGANEMDTMRRVVAEEPLEPRRLRPDVPPGLQTICLQCLRKEPGQRYAGAGELAEDLRRFRRGEPVRARPLSAPQRAWAWARRRPTTAALIAASAAALLLLQLGVWWHLHRLGQTNADLAEALQREQQQRQGATNAESHARREQQRAEEQATLARRHAYVNQVRFAAQAVESGQPWRGVEALNRLRPRSGEPDQRGPEWYEIWRRCRREALFLVGHSGTVRTLAFTPDGHTLAAAGDDQTIRLWDTTTGEVRATLQGHSGIVDKLAISPDGRTLAAASKDKLVRLWDLATGQPQTSLFGHQKPCKAVAFSPDGRWLASAGHDDTIRLWKLDDRREHLCLMDQPACSLAFSPDGRWLAAGGAEVKVWNLATGREPLVLKRPGKMVLSVAFSPDGRTLASGGTDATVQLWDLATAQARHTLRGHTGAVAAVAFAPDGQVLASGAHDNTVRLWEVATGRERRQLPQPGEVGAVAFSPSGRILAYGGGAPHVVTLHDLNGPAPAPSTRPLLPHKVWAVAFSPDGRTLASSSQLLLATLWEPATGRVRTHLPLLWSDVYTVAFSPDGRTLAAGTAAGGVVLCDVASGTVRATLRGHRARVTAVAFAPDGNTLASASWDKTVKLWEPATGALRRTLEGHPDEVRGLAFAPDGRVLASGGREDGVRLWSTATGQLEGILPDSFQGHALAFSPDGQTLATGNNLGLVKLWDWRRGQAVAVLPGHPGGVKAVTFAPDGQTLASAGLDKTIKLWDMTTKLELVTLLGHTDEVNAVAFSPDSKVLASASHDGTVKFWRAAEAPQP
jgi:WD40 repeat protein/serine/threonine protein kinase